MTTLLKNYLKSTPESAHCSAAIASLAALDHLQKEHPLIAQQMIKELQEQRRYLKLIASENYCSPAVQLAMGNWLTDKYAEGYAHHRFYGGCAQVDVIEEEGERLLKELFGCESAYLQPHSGADANLVAFYAILMERIQNPAIEKLGKKSLDELNEKDYETLRQMLINQKVMGLSLSSGGHLTHGFKHNLSSKMFQSIPYDVDKESELIHLDTLAKQVKKERPLVLIAGYSSYPRKLNFAKLREIAESVNAVLMVDMAHFSGLVAGKVFQGEYNPIPYAHVVTSTTHKTLRGPRGGIILCQKEFEEQVHKGCPLVLGGPLPHVMAAKVVAFQEALQPDFQTYAHRIVENCQTLADTLKRGGIRLITGGTDNHLIVFDVSPFGLTGRQVELALREAHLTVNRNSIPFDPQGAWYTSGIRIGTAALTTLGMGFNEMQTIGKIIIDVLKNTRPATIEKTGKPSKSSYILDPSTQKKAQAQVEELLGKHPLYPHIKLDN